MIDGNWTHLTVHPMLNFSWILVDRSRGGGNGNKNKDKTQVFLGYPECFSKLNRNN